MTPFNIQKAVKLTEGAYSVSFAALESNTAHSKANFEKSLASMTNGKFSFADRSIVNYAKEGYNRLYRGIILANRESRPYDEQSVAGMNLVTANVFTDEDDNVWNVVGEGDSKRIVQVSSTDYDAILQEKIRRSKIVASSTITQQTPFIAGDYAMIYSTKEDAPRFGFLYNEGNKSKIYRRDNQRAEEIHPFQVVCSVVIDPYSPLMLKDVKKEDIDTIVQASSSTPISRYLDYMRTLFDGTAYFAALEKALQDHPLA